MCLSVKDKDSGHEENDREMEKKIWEKWEKEKGNGSVCLTFTYIVGRNLPFPALCDRWCNLNLTIINICTVLLLHLAL